MNLTSIMSTPSTYLLRTEILVSFKFPVDLTLNLLRNQPLHQFHYGSRYNLSGLDYGKGPEIDITTSVQHLTPPQIKSILPPATTVTLLKGKSDYMPSLFKRISPLFPQRGSPSPSKAYKPLHNLIPHSRLPLSCISTAFTLLTPPQPNQPLLSSNAPSTLLPLSSLQVPFLLLEHSSLREVQGLPFHFPAVLGSNVIFSRKSSLATSS